MRAIDQHHRRLDGALGFVLIFAVLATGFPACYRTDTGDQQSGGTGAADEPGPGGAGSTSDGDGGTGGRAPGGAGGTTGGRRPTTGTGATGGGAIAGAGGTTGGRHISVDGGVIGQGATNGRPEGGEAGGDAGGGSSSTDPFEWLEQQGERCEPTSASPAELPSEPNTDCRFFEIGLPGVMEYSADPSAFDLDRTGSGGLYKYMGCDEIGSPCAGKLEYTSKVEYLADNEWELSITPVRDECDYDHALLHELPTGELAPRGTLSWAPVRVTLHLRPTAKGLTIGAIRTPSDELIPPGWFTEMQFNGGWQEDEIRGLLDQAFVDHLQALEWECAHAAP